MNVNDQIKRAAIWHLTRRASSKAPWWVALVILVIIAILGAD